MERLGASEVNRLCEEHQGGKSATDLEGFQGSSDPNTHSESLGGGNDGIGYGMEEEAMDSDDADGEDDL